MWWEAWDLRRSALTCVVDPLGLSPAAIVRALPMQGDLFGHIADLTGGLSSSMVGLVLPGLIYLEATRGIDGMPKVAWYRRGCYALVILGTLTAIAVPTSVVLSALGYD